jgi:hypothetical protein
MSVIFVSVNNTLYDPLINKLMSSLEKNGYDTLALGVFRHHGSKVKQVNENQKHLILQLSLLSMTKKLNYIRLPLAYLEYIIKLITRLIKHRPMIIYSFNFSTLIPVVLYKLFFNKTRIIYHARELESQEGTNKILNITIYLIETLCILLVNYVVTPSDSISKWYKDRFSINTMTLYNSPFVKEDFRINDSYFHDKFKIPFDERLFIHSGALCEGRNIELLIEIFSQNELGVLVFIGPITSAKYSYIAYNNIKNIYYHKSVKYELLVKYLSTASAGLCIMDNKVLNERYALPNKFLEYVNARLPIISSENENLMALTTKYKLGISVAPIKAQIIDAIKLIVNDENEFYIDVPEELTWKHQEIKFLCLIDELKI